MAKRSDGKTTDDRARELVKNEHINTNNIAGLIQYNQRVDEIKRELDNGKKK